MNNPKEKVNRLGIMGGTFDPIHYGHLVAAEMARAEFKLSKVLFIPTGTPPHKDRKDISAAEMRYEMVKLAIQDNPAFDISRVEIEREGPSYTVETLRVLRRDWPEHELYFITGSDALLEIFSWREAEEIFRLIQYIGAARPGFDASDFFLKVQHEHPETQGKIHYLEVPALAISSTDIRARVRRREPIRYLLPETVRLYLEQHRLYADS
ncbi:MULTISPECIES: nicotinate-nucleotide adenylyltransferase [Desulfosporosinus]|uniref:Probable nicotinate-nucleotide adenylyltransferase n=1 Tax=Desulfosporosinus nitroreducens TaxID=2018668 RepID=A0ABT8QKS8_9FIRM|nr:MULTISPECIES: nicotinate-nucleotide adenylyltransferase [Desulfosporosinus]MCO5385718.1 nicotinate-nucleotide adenylyltransferase [Desulfosporosinus sp.]MDA8221520.1 nicotinate-nucleotide adenylyltransferase [Desulfitobacterium hafniense]MDO0821931.1 nicotinate-nucleotide adenylyltransferase [Desulfosporosinus nitroreducens]